MRRQVLAIAAVGLAVVAIAPVASAQTATGDSVTGSGTARFVSGGLSGLTVPFDINVQAGPNGENPTGTVTLLLTFTDPGCLVVRDGGGAEAPSAAINLRNPVTGGRVIVQIGGGEAGPQLIGFLSASSPTDCSFGDPVDVAEVISGQIRIVDAPPLPTSADQCKNGGWRNFPGFRNQGDCVSFVVTGGTKTPSG